MSAGASRVSSIGVTPVRWLLVVVAGVILLFIALTGWMGDRPVQAEQAQNPVIPPPAESTAQATPSPVVTASPTAIPVSTVVATPPPPTPIPTTVTPALPFLTVGGDARVNVRTSPGTDYARIGSLEPGVYAAILGRHGDWWQIEHEGSLGWVAGWLVLAMNVSDVPEVELPPLPVVEVAPSPTPILPPRDELNCRTTTR